MAKIDQVTNDEDRDAMQSRIIKAAVHIADPLLSPEEKARLIPVYDEMVRIMKAYDRAQYAKKYPGVRKIYEQLGWIVADLPEETNSNEQNAPMEPFTPLKARQFENGEKTAVKSNTEVTEPSVDDDYASAADWL